VRSYACALRDYFTFLDAHRIDWVTVRLEHLGRFVAWLRLPPDARPNSQRQGAGEIRRADLTGLRNAVIELVAQEKANKQPDVGVIYSWRIHSEGLAPQNYSGSNTSQ
jgi:hypothetical protein